MAEFVNDIFDTFAAFIIFIILCYHSYHLLSCFGNNKISLFKLFSIFVILIQFLYKLWDATESWTIYLKKSPSACQLNIIGSAILYVISKAFIFWILMERLFLVFKNSELAFK
eukprot:163093_1